MKKSPFLSLRSLIYWNINYKGTLVQGNPLYFAFCLRAFSSLGQIQVNQPLCTLSYLFSLDFVSIILFSEKNMGEVLDACAWRVKMRWETKETPISCEPKRYLLWRHGISENPFGIIINIGNKLIYFYCICCSGVAYTQRCWSHMLGSSTTYNPFVPDPHSY